MKDISFTFFSISILLLYSYLILGDSTSQIIYDFSFSDLYLLLVLSLLGFVFLAALSKKLHKLASSNIIRTTYLIVFLPVVLFPVLICYFRIPYLLCQRCPKKCIWGYLRPILIPSFLVVNLQNKIWCATYCPVGFMQGLLGSLIKKKCRPKQLKYLGYLILGTIIMLYFLIQKTEIFSRAFKHTYSTSLVVIVVAGIMLIGSVFVSRLWCNNFCPIGTTSDIISSGEKKLLK